MEYREEYRTVISGLKAANRTIIDDGSVAPFVANTDFDDSPFIVVQNGMQSKMELELDGVSHRDDGLHLDISIDSPQGGPDDLLIHSLLIRITDEDGDVRKKVSTDIEGYTDPSRNG